MRNTGLFFVALIAITALWTGCNKTKTYAEKLKDEKKAIERFIDKNNIKVLKKMPADSVFESNEFLKTEEGLYLNVINWRYFPENNDSIKAGDEVAVRAKRVHEFMTKDIASYNWNANYPDIFKYDPSRIEGGTYPLAWDIAIKYVNNYALVKMIIPSVISSKYYREYVTPIYFDSLWFKRLQ